MTDARRARADGAARDRPRALGLGRGRPQPVLLPRRARRPRSTTSYLDGIRKDGLLDRRRHRGGGRGRAAGPRRADLRQARRGPRRGADVDQRRQGRRDRRRLRRRDPARRGERRRDAGRQRRRAGVPVEPRRRHPRRHLDRPAGRVPLRRQADLVDPRRRAPPSRAPARRPRSSTKGRHDPCVGIRAVPVGEAMVACVLADHFLRHRGQVGEGVAVACSRS